MRQKMAPALRVDAIRKLVPANRPEAAGATARPTTDERRTASSDRAPMPPYPAARSDQDCVSVTEGSAKRHPPQRGGWSTREVGRGRSAIEKGAPHKTSQACHLGARISDKLHTLQHCRDGRRTLRVGDRSDRCKLRQRSPAIGVAAIAVDRKADKDRNEG